MSGDGIWYWEVKDYFVAVTKSLFCIVRFEQKIVTNDGRSWSPLWLTGGHLLHEWRHMLQNTFNEYTLLCVQWQLQRKPMWAVPALQQLLQSRGGRVNCSRGHCCPTHFSGAGICYLLRAQEAESQTTEPTEQPATVLESETKSMTSLPAGLSSACVLDGMMK